MRVYAQFDAEGFPRGFWTEDVWRPQPNGQRHAGIPPEAIEIKEEHWREFIAHQGLRRWENGQVVVFEPPPPPERFPIISDRQFYQAAALMGKITKDEALAIVSTGTLPQTLKEFIEHIADPQQQFSVHMLLSGATQFDRTHPLVNQLGHAFNLTPQEIDELWRFAATL